MSPNSASSVPSHLGYYKEQGISPVKYDISDLRAHFDRREALYRALGLPPAALKGCDVLEVAPGSGQNSLYVASALPALYDLVEPNPVAIADITALYGSVALPHTKPRLHAAKLEEFLPGRSYDVVICENWLSSLAHERPLIRKLASLLAPGGVLVITFMPLTGFFPNILRKLFALRLTEPSASFAEQTAFLADVFGPHLGTIRSMTRSHDHWVQDCMLNPHFLTVVLSLDVVLEEVGPACEVLSSVPHFATDWRWFKSLVGDERQFSENFRRSYRENLHNFVDYRRTFAPRPASENGALDAACTDLHMAALAWQAAQLQGRANQRAFDQITSLLEILATELGKVDREFKYALDEAREAWIKPVLEPRRVKEMEHFGALFGRETVYLSNTRAR